MISPKKLLRISTAVSAVALTLFVAAAPAYAMQDIAIDDSSRSFATAVEGAQGAGDSMPDNPNAALPDTVSERIPDDSTVVSEKLAVTPEGEVRDIETGKAVTDETLVGTQDQQPDPLAKTDGESFIPVSASDVKDAVEQSVKQSVEQSSSKNGATVKLAKFDGNDYGAHWGTYNNTKAFFDYKNNLFVQQAKGVIDVSSWQGDIDWAKAKADGVEGAIIRLGFGWGNDADTKAQRNISECKRLGIPFGIYWYSYAEDADGAKHEGSDVVSKLRQMGVSPNDLKYPVYYDLERWTWTGHTPPTDPNVYNGIANAWYSALQSGGYQNLGVYSYTSYLQGPLNNANIYAKTRWVAQYGPRMEFTAFGTNDRGWQYTESGHINGISGSVDMNAFGNKTYAQDSASIDVRKMSAVTSLNGEYNIRLREKTNFDIDIPNASKADSVAIQLYTDNGTKAQRFKFIKQSDNSYVIVNVNSGKALDVRNAAAGNNAIVQQYTANGTTAQKWFIRDSGNGYYLQSALGNWVLDLNGNNVSNGSAIRLYAPNGTAAQKWTFTPVHKSTRERLDDLAYANRDVLSDGTYSFASKLKASMKMDVYGAARNSGANVQLWTGNGTSAQRWKVAHDGNGYVTLTSANSGKVLDIYGAGTANGANVQQYTSNGTYAQKWIVIKNSDGSYTFQSALAENKVLDVCGASTANGANVQLYSANGTNAQKWVK